MEGASGLVIEDKMLIRKLLYEVEEALKVLKSRVDEGVRDIGDAFAVRYAIIQIVECLAIISSKLAEVHGAVIEGYVEAMKFLSRLGIVDSEAGEALVRLARLRNLLVHRYWVIDDGRIIKEVRESGIRAIEVAVEGVRRLLEGQGLLKGQKAV